MKLINLVSTTVLNKKKKNYKYISVQDNYANTLEKIKPERTRKARLSQKMLSLTRILSTTIQVKATIISAAKYTLNQNVTARFFISSFSRQNITQTIIYNFFKYNSNKIKHYIKQDKCRKATT